MTAPIFSSSSSSFSVVEPVGLVGIPAVSVLSGISVSDDEGYYGDSLTIGLTDARSGEAIGFNGTTARLVGSGPGAGVEVNLGSQISPNWVLIGHVATESSTEVRINFDLPTAFESRVNLLLNAVTFSATSDDPTALGTDTQRTISFTLTDANDPSNPAPTVFNATLNITATNDAAVISGTSTGTVTEAGGVANATPGTPTATGTLTSTDVDGVANSFQAVTSTATASGYGTYAVDASGHWTYALNNDNETVQALGGTGPASATDTFQVLAADGTAQTVTITINGANDISVVGGATTGEVTEAGGVSNGTPGTPTAAGTLTSTDVDGTANSFNAASGSASYGTFTVDNQGHWTYALDNGDGDVQALGPTEQMEDNFTVYTADGVAQVVTVTIKGANDAAVITGTASATLTETNAPESTGGTLNVSDVDSPATFVEQTNVAGLNGYGTFSINSAGVWTYTMTSPHDEFVAGATYTDSLTVTTADGTTQTLSVTINGTNDAPTVTGALTSTVDEGDPTYTLDLLAGATDLDTGETATLSIANVTYAVDGGMPSGTAPAGLVLNGSTLSVDPTDAAFDGLGTGQNRSIVVSYDVVDAHGGITTQTETITIRGTNDPATFTGSDSAVLTETNVPQATGGTLTVSDVDSDASFEEQTNVAGSNGYGTFSIDAGGTWTYTMTSPHNEFVKDQVYTDTLTVMTADGTPHTLTVDITGTNDGVMVAGVLSSNATEGAPAYTLNLLAGATDLDMGETATLSVTNVTYSVDGGLASTTVPAGLSLSGSTLSVDPTNAAFDGLGNGQPRAIVVTYDIVDVHGATITQTETITITGVNDPATFSGTDTQALTETDAVLTTGGTLDVNDVDSFTTVVPQTDAPGSHNYGTFTIDSAGVWSYTMTSPHNEFEAGQVYTDTLTVTTDDGTTHTLTVNITGTNDAAIISGGTEILTETDAPESIGGALTISDVDSPTTFVPLTQVGSNGFGTFTIDSAGVWSYTMNSAHDEFVDGQLYTDSVTVTSADGTEHLLSVDITGTNDAAVITGGTASLTETNAAQTTGGTLVISDPDSPQTFVDQTDVAGSNGYGTFSIDSAGVWTYTMTSAHDEFVDGQTYTDSLTVTSDDGTQHTLTVQITGTNDAAVITGDDEGAVTEAGGVANGTAGNPTATGSLTSTDVDGPNNAFLPVTTTATTSGYGTYEVDASGNWSYTLDDSNPAVQALAAGATTTDTFQVLAADGTAQTVTVTITGANDAAAISGTTTGSVTEAGGVANGLPGIPTATGTLTSTDIDGVANSFQAVTTPASTTLGSYTVDATGPMAATTWSTAARATTRSMAARATTR